MSTVFGIISKLNINCLLDEKQFKQVIMEKAGGNEVADAILSYSNENKDLVLRIKDNLVKQGLSVWMGDSEGMSATEVLQKIGQAVVDCRLFVFVMSVTSVQSKLCQDQLALAYISSKPIFPVAIVPFSELRELMNNGMKLQLARFPSIPIDNETLDDDTEKLAGILHDELNKLKNEDEKDVDEAERPKLQRQYTMNMGRRKEDEGIDNPMLMEKPTDFWKRHFVDEEVIPWIKFLEAMTMDFQEELDRDFGANDTEWLIGIIQRELDCDQSDFIIKDTFLEYCTSESKVRPLWLMIKELAVQSYAIRDVFSIGSSVRVKAIENLAKFKSMAVIDALRDLLSDKDSSIRSVAIISLAKTGANDELTIRGLIKCLESKDRLVREAACLALGHIKAERATDKIVDLWRNDKISNVRDAAYVALQNIGGEQAAEAIRITQVLEKEIRRLKSNPAGST
ncbi:hypothetical protein ScPMuIL_006294 [Solemya velum]